MDLPAKIDLLTGNARVFAETLFTAFPDWGEFINDDSLTAGGFELRVPHHLDTKHDIQLFVEENDLTLYFSAWHTHGDLVSKGGVKSQSLGLVKTLKQILHDNIVIGFIMHLDRNDARYQSCTYLKAKEAPKWLSEGIEGENRNITSWTGKHDAPA